MNTIHHIAIIPDGNRRWAKEHGLPSFAGHKKGYENVIELGRKVRELGIEVFTFWAFSTENWKREKTEVDYLMNLSERVIGEYLNEALKNEIRFIHMGRKDRLRKELRKAIADVEYKTKKFSKYYFIIALDYGGQDEIIRSIKRLAKAKENCEQIDPQKFSQYLDLRDVPYPNPDIIIRTSGEERLSGFMPWYSGYSELFFVKKHFPAFSPLDLEKCIKEFHRRQRRFGR